MSSLSQFTFLTFNILANRFTNFNKSDKKNESRELMQERYDAIILHLENLNKDICFLQEVDNHFYYALISSPLKNKYYITHRYYKAYKVERNKDDIGQLMMIKTSKFKAPLSLNKTFDSIHRPNSTAFSIRGGFSSVFDFVKLTNYGAEGNQRKFAQILIVTDSKGHYLILANMHLEGNPDYQKLKEMEFEETYKACVSFIKNKMNDINSNNIHMIFSGDFNEPEQSIVQNIMIADKPLKLINKDHKQMTAFSKYFTDKKTNERKEINKLEKLDYLLCSDNLIYNGDMNTYPNFEIKYMPDWDKPFLNKKKLNTKNWISDHISLDFSLSLPIKTGTNKIDKILTISKKINNRKLSNKKTKNKKKKSKHKKTTKKK